MTDDITPYREALDEARAAVTEAEEILARVEREQWEAKHAALLRAIEEAPEEPAPILGPLHEFYLTVGTGYSPNAEPKHKHPVYPTRLSGAGFIVIEAPSLGWAQALAWVHLGEKFSSVYKSDPREHAPDYARGSWYRAGEIGRMDAYGNLVWNDDVWRALL